MGYYIPVTPTLVAAAVGAAWADLDLSGTVGTQVTTVYLEVRGTRAVAVRTKGENTTTHTTTSTGSKGLYSGKITGTGDAFLLCVNTDTNGVIQTIEAGGGGGGAVDIYLIGYQIPTGYLIDSFPYSQLCNVTYQDVNPWLTTVSPSGDSWAFIGTKRTSSALALTQAVRANGSSEDFLGALADFQGGVSAVYHHIDPAFATEAGLGTIIPSSSIIEHSNNGGAFSCGFRIASWQDKGKGFYYANQNVFTSQLVDNLSWTDVDLSSYIGAKECMCVFKVTIPGGSATSIVALRPNGSSRVWLDDGVKTLGTGIQQMKGQAGDYALIMCPTDSSGIVEIRSSAKTPLTLDLYGVFYPEDYSTAPTIVSSALYPAAGSVASFSRPTELRFSVEDTSGVIGLIPSTLNLKVVDPLGVETSIITNGAAATGVTGFYYSQEDNSGLFSNPLRLNVRLNFPSIDLMPNGRTYSWVLDVDNSMGVPA